MLSVLRSMLETIVALIGFITHAVSSLVTLIAHIPAYTAFLVSSINVLPAIIIPFAIASVSLGAVLFILGR